MSHPSQKTIALVLSQSLSLHTAHLWSYIEPGSIPSSFPYISLLCPIVRSFFDESVPLESIPPVMEFIVCSNLVHSVSKALINISNTSGVIFTTLVVFLFLACKNKKSCSSISYSTSICLLSRNCFTAISESFAFLFVFLVFAISNGRM